MTNIATELLEFYKTHEWCRNDWTRQIRGKTHYCMSQAVTIIHPQDYETKRNELQERLLKTSGHMILTTNDNLCRTKKDVIKVLERAAGVQL